MINYSDIFVYNRNLYNFLFKDFVSILSISFFKGKLSESSTPQKSIINKNGRYIYKNTLAFYNAISNSKYVNGNYIFLRAWLKASL